MSHEAFMHRALACAEKAKALGEVPVGAVIVKDGKIIATGYNRRETGKNALLHAEIVALNRACKKVGGWRLSDCDLYVTLEPCPMCAGAIINARIRRVYIGAMDPKAGCMGSVCNLTELPFNHQPGVVSGILEAECSQQLSAFFAEMRNLKKTEQKEISLRTFTQNDLPVLKQYLYSNRSNQSISAIIDQWNTKMLEGRYRESFAVTVDNQPVGLLQLTEESAENVRIEVHIFSDYRGKTYGTQTVLKALFLAKEKGYFIATAQIRKNHIPSCRLSDSVGFLRAGEDVMAKGQQVWNLTYSLTN